MRKFSSDHGHVADLFSELLHPLRQGGEALGVVVVPPRTLRSATFSGDVSLLAAVVTLNVGVVTTPLLEVRAVVGAAPAVTGYVSRLAARVTFPIVPPRARATETSSGRRGPLPLAGVAVAGHVPVLPAVVAFHFAVSIPPPGCSGVRCWCSY